MSTFDYRGMHQFRDMTIFHSDPTLLKMTPNAIFVCIFKTMCLAMLIAQMYDWTFLELIIDVNGLIPLGPLSSQGVVFNLYIIQWNVTSIAQGGVEGIRRKGQLASMINSRKGQSYNCTSSLFVHLFYRVTW